MNLENLFNSDLFKWVILPLMIFFARLIDVSLGTIRIIFISRGFKYIAPLIAFFEINIWLLAIAQIMLNLNNPVCSIAYAGGFAMGNFVGMLLEEKISIGSVIVRIIVKHDSDKIYSYLKSEKYGVTIVDAKGIEGEVKLIFVVIRRGDLKKILNHIKTIHPHAFYTVEDVRTVQDAVLPITRKGLFRVYRKVK
jgi:uncharacterized protein YebE (UPF0316 family)